MSCNCVFHYFARYTLYMQNTTHLSRYMSEETTPFRGPRRSAPSWTSFSSNSAKQFESSKDGASESNQRLFFSVGSSESAIVFNAALSSNLPLTATFNFSIQFSAPFYYPPQTQFEIPTKTNQTLLNFSGFRRLVDWTSAAMEASSSSQSPVPRLHHFELVERMKLQVISQNYQKEGVFFYCLWCHGLVV